jgi:hypothetical protein
LISGLACLLAFLLASVVVSAFQRRKYAGAGTGRARVRPASAHRTRTSGRAATAPNDTRPDRRSGGPPALRHEDEISGFGWPTRGALER